MCLAIVPAHHFSPWRKMEPSVDQYVLSRGSDGTDRLRLLSRVMGPTTEALLAEAGISSGMRCLDLGCGVGAVTILMAERVGPQGAAIGIDPNSFFLDQAKREATRLGSGATFLSGAVGDLTDRHVYDLVYA